MVNSLGWTYREPFFRSVSRNYRIWLFLGGPGRTAVPGWELPYLAGHTVVDTGSAGMMLAAARRLIADGETVAGILCYDEARLVASATVARALGLPTSDPEAFARCRDKAATRAALAEAGVPQTACVAVGFLAEAEAAPRGSTRNSS
ncbi:hypothetical protein [Micromonospora haikouensis]|uniref:hypothetical protein n=1 Tax=Micromonospora haikouensis TaxID=686309 RepID=UPI003D728838